MPLPQLGSLSPGTVIADCRIERLLGVGGMGEVYLATHLRLEKLVALKILPRRSVGHPDAVTRFLREAKLAAKISHQNVIKILDVNHRGDDHFILMDYVEGSNLAELVKRVGMPLPYRQALRLVQLAARGAAAVHECGLIHRDIKPANIMLTTKKGVILMDFGLVREVESSEVTNPGAVLGTPAFMSPEQSRGEPLDPRSDVFALGGTLYYLLTAKLPFEGSQVEVMIQLQKGRLPRPACEVNPYVPEAVSDFLNRVMAPRREDRPKSATLLANEIKKFLELPDPRAHETHDTTDDSKLKTGPHREPEFDLVPLESIRSRKPMKLTVGYTIAIGSFLLLSVAVGSVLIFGSKPGNPPRASEKQPEKIVERPGMAYIPAGAVQIGNAEEELRKHFSTVELKDAQIAFSDFLDYSTFPPRTEQVPAFWMDKYETSNAEYAKFVLATGHSVPTGHSSPEEKWNGNNPPPGREQFPVTMITHADAVAYAEWAGKKLPTERQFVRAFRGDGTSLYPWGNTWEPARAVVYENLAFGGLSKVNETPRDVSPFGIFNLVGNVTEMLREKLNRDGRTWVVVRGARLSPGDAIRVIASHYTLQTEGAMIGKTGFRCVHEGP